MLRPLTSREPRGCRTSAVGSRHQATAREDLLTEFSIITNCVSAYIYSPIEDSEAVFEHSAGLMKL
jgi:hypothetical protein